jgi:fatty acid desaturase
MVVSRDAARQLRKRLQAAGVFERREGAAWVMFLGLLGVFAGLTAIQITGPLWLSVLIVPLQGLVLTPIAMHGHDGVHRAHSTRGWSNDLIGFLAFPLLGGLGTVYWRMKHNGAHHVHPNLITEDKRDPDMNMWPLATTRMAYDESGAVRRLFQRTIQAYAFWPITTLMAPMMRVLSFVYLARYVRKKGVDKAVVLDLLCLAAHYTLWLVIPASIFGLAPVLGVYIGAWAVVGLMLAVIFAPGHMGLPVVSDYGDFWALQLQTTRNLRLPRGLGWYFVGLNHQIEHHLFQNIAASQLPAAAPIVRSWCEEHGLPYHECTLGEGISAVTQFLHTSWNTPRVSLAPATTDTMAAR